MGWRDGAALRARPFLRKDGVVTRSIGEIPNRELFVVLPSIAARTRMSARHGSRRTELAVPTKEE
jgi:hypothetical protein